MRREREHLLPPLRIVLREGESLYLPAGWYHHVSQLEDEPPKQEVGGGNILDAYQGAACVCLNFWYDAPAGFGDRWAWSNFASSLRRRAAGNFGPEEDDL